MAGDQAWTQPSGPTYQNLTVQGNVTLTGLPSSGTPINAVCQNSSKQMMACAIPTQVNPFAASAGILASIPGSTGATLIITAPAIPQASYQWTSTACSFNDGGSQVPPTGGGCWNLTAQSLYDIRWWALPSNPINFYVTTGGNDYGSPGSGANFCVVSSIPCATPTQASAMMNKFCAQGGNVWLNLPASSSWAYTIQQNGPLPCSGNGVVSGEQGEVVVNGGGASTVLTGGSGQNRAVDAKTDAILAVQNITLSDINSGATDAWAEIGGIIDIYAGVVLGAAPAQLLHSEDPGTQINLWDSLTVSGGSAAAWLAVTSASVEFNPVGGSPTVTFTGSPTFSSEIADAGYNGVIYIGSDWSFSGAVTGPKFLVLDGGVLQYNGVTLPGSSGGKIQGGGVIDPTVPPISYTLTAGNLGTGGSITTNFGSDLSGYFNVTTGSSGVSSQLTIQVNYGSSLQGRVCGFQPASGYLLSGFFANSTGFTSTTGSMFVNSTSALPSLTNLLFQYQCTGE